MSPDLRPIQLTEILVSFSRRSIFIVLFILLLTWLLGAPVFADSPLWKFDLASPYPVGCKVAYARPKEGNNKPGLVFDTREQTSEWNSCVCVPAGLLKQGQDYTVTVSYEIVERTDPDGMFYVFARSPRSGNGADHWTKWSGEAGKRGVAKLRITPTADDYGVCAGIRKRGVMRILNMNIESGSGYASLPLNVNRNINRNSESKSQNPNLEASKATGAVEFTVNQPENTKGLVLNLADFGVVTDTSGSSESEDAVANASTLPAPSPDSDKNLVAFKKALDECRTSRASKLTIPKGVYRFTSGNTIKFEELSDFTFDGQGSTFIFDQIKGGAGLQINKCTRTVFTNFNMDWDWNKDPLGWVGRIIRTTPDKSSFEMRFDTLAPLDTKQWVTMNPLDEKLRAPGAGKELGGFNPKKIEKIDAHTVRVWPSYPLPVVPGKLYLLRHYISDKHCIILSN